MSVPLIGPLSFFYLNVGNYGTPNFSSVTLVSDCNVNAEWDKGEASARASRVKMNAKTMLGLSVTAKLRADLSDANYTTILNALGADTVLNVMVLNGAKTVNGVRGWMFDCQVFKGSEDQGLSQVVFTEVEFDPYPSGNAPNQVLVTAGAPVMSPL